ncbi:MAG: hypothetical protein ABSC63_02840 [Candidatus Binataceae bacterium]
MKPPARFHSEIKAAMFHVKHCRDLFAGKFFPRRGEELHPRAAKNFTLAQITQTRRGPINERG